MRVAPLKRKDRKTQERHHLHWGVRGSCSQKTQVKVPSYSLLWAFGLAFTAATAAVVLLQALLSLSLGVAVCVRRFQVQHCKRVRRFVGKLSCARIVQTHFARSLQAVVRFALRVVLLAKGDATRLHRSPQVRLLLASVHLRCVVPCAGQG